MIRIALTTLLSFFLFMPSAHAKGHNKSSLFKELGGRKAITLVVDNFIGRCAADPRISSFFQGVASDKKKMARFRSNLIAQVCEASGGPCKYKGKDMRTAHAGMGITEAHFDALVENLSASLDKFKVKAKSKSQLLSKLAPMKADIVSPTERAMANDASETSPKPE